MIKGLVKCAIRRYRLWRAIKETRKFFGDISMPIDNLSDDEVCEGICMATMSIAKLSLTTDEFAAAMHKASADIKEALDG